MRIIVNKITRETSATWWDGLNTEQKESYIKAHPNSKYAKKSSTQDKKKPKDIKFAGARLNLSTYDRLTKKDKKDLQDLQTILKAKSLDDLFTAFPRADSAKKRFLADTKKAMLNSRTAKRFLSVIREELNRYRNSEGVIELFTTTQALNYAQVKKLLSYAERQARKHGYST